MYYLCIDDIFQGTLQAKTSGAIDVKCRQKKKLRRKVRAHNAHGNKLRCKVGAHNAYEKKLRHKDKEHNVHGQKKLRQGPELRRT